MKLHLSTGEVIELPKELVADFERDYDLWMKGSRQNKEFRYGASGTEHFIRFDAIVRREKSV